MKSNEGMDRRNFLKGIAALSSGAVFWGAGVAGTAALNRPTGVSVYDASWRADVPRRLCDLTRDLSNRALSGEHGRSMKAATFALDESEVAGLGADMRYARACKLVAEKAPLRIVPGEKIVGAATLVEGRGHRTPVADVDSTSHTTIGFHRMLRTGYRALREQIAERFAREGGDDLDIRGADFLQSANLCLDAAAIWHKRYMDRLAELAEVSTGAKRDGYLEIRSHLADVPENPPRNFREAVQSLWFLYAFQRLMGNWTGIGRIDEMLGPYLKANLQSGAITLDEAREILAHFWIKGCEWITGAPCGGGDAQHYQNIVIGGVDANGDDVTNEVTYLVLDIVEELHISDFPIGVRVNRDTPKELLRRIAEVQRHGGGIVAIYNEEVVVESLVNFGYPIEEARTFTNDGCWEVLIPGKTSFKYSPFDAVQMLQSVLGLDDSGASAPDFERFEDLYGALMERLQKRIDLHNHHSDHFFNNHHPAPLLSLFVEDCIEKARGYHSRGARYVVFSPHIGGLPDVANSLLVIDKLVYKKKDLTLAELIGILRDDWNGAEALRAKIQKKFKFYGNDSDKADDLVKRLFNDYVGMVEEVPYRKGCYRPAGISTFGRHVTWRNQRRAMAQGSRNGDVLACNFSPTPGADAKGPTAVIKSHCKMDYSRLPGGATLELKILPSSIEGDRGRDALVSLIRSFVKLGGYYMHVDVVDTAMLIEAQRVPDKYPNLSVRIAGWSARFATLNKDHQDMVIARTQQVV